MNVYTNYFKRKPKTSLHNKWLAINNRILTLPSPIRNFDGLPRDASTLLWRIFFNYPARSEEEEVAHRAYHVYAYRKILKNVRNEYLQARLTEVGHGR